MPAESGVKYTIPGWLHLCFRGDLAKPLGCRALSGKTSWRSWPQRQA